MTDVYPPPLTIRGVVHPSQPFGLDAVPAYLETHYWWTCIFGGLPEERSWLSRMCSCRFLGIQARR